MWQGEGVAYRGRVLIELSTRLDDKIDKKVDDLNNDDVLVAQVTACSTGQVTPPNEFHFTAFIFMETFSGEVSGYEDNLINLANLRRNVK